MSKRTHSRYLTMRDGARIAVDVHLPASASSRPLPAIVRQTRYYRGVHFRGPFARLPIEWLIDHTALTRDRFIANGYAWVDVCVRGSGASFGSRTCPWSPEEIADGHEVLDWMVAQPWCNGQIGSTGVSYDGTSAEFLLTTGHPALKAIAPRFSLFDVFTDVAFPGGVHLAWFTEQWGDFNRALDAGSLDIAFAMKLRNQLRALRELNHSTPVKLLLSILDRDGLDTIARPLLRAVSHGVRPVDSDVDGSLLHEAVNQHSANFDVHEGALALRNRDDAGISPVVPERVVDDFSPHKFIEQLRASDAAIYSYSGWLDAAYQRAAIRRYQAVQRPGNRLILGPWDHGGMHNASPHCPHREAGFDHDGELVRFFDRHLRKDDTHASPNVRYFTIGEERWKSCDAWPPPGTQPQRWYLGDARQLQREAPSRNNVDEYRVDPTVGSGRRARWDSLLGLLPPVGYTPPKNFDERLLVYRSARLAHAIEVTGQPRATLWVSSTTTDAHLFVYLLEELEDGSLHGVTEGQLAARHRRTHDRDDEPTPYRSFASHDAEPLEPGVAYELYVDLLPVSWRFARGRRVVLAIAGADCDHFEVLEPTPTFGMHRGGLRASFLELPIMA